MKLYPPHLPIYLGSLSRFTHGPAFAATSSATSLAAATWPTSNRAYYIPLSLPWPYPVKRVWWINGSNTTGNVDLGVYRAQDGLKLASIGSTARSGTTAVQYVSVDWAFAPGEYYLAMGCNNNGGSFIRTSGMSANNLRMFGQMHEDTFPLPSSMTPALETNAYTPLFGLTRLSSF
jgi:hypothetical protein